MTQTEHLKLIRARCVELLEIAEKRTPGEWYVNQYHIGILARHNRSSQVAKADFSYDAAFIASCAGPAEAGWRSTITMIDSVFQMRKHVKHVREVMMAASLIEDDILAAWPLELLNP